MTPFYAVHIRHADDNAERPVEWPVARSMRDVFEHIDNGTGPNADWIQGEPERIRVYLCVPGQSCEDVTADALRQYAAASHWPAWLIDFAPDDLREEHAAEQARADAADRDNYERKLEAAE